MIEKIRNRFRQKAKEATQPTAEMTQILKDREDQGRITAALKRMAAQEFKDNIDPVAPCGRRTFDEKYVFGYALEVAGSIVTSLKWEYKTGSSCNKIGLALILLADTDAACLIIADLAKYAPGLLSRDFTDRIDRYLHRSVIKNIVLDIISETPEGKFIVHEWSNKPLLHKASILVLSTHRVQRRQMAIQKLARAAPDVYDLEDWDLRYPDNFISDIALQLYPAIYWNRLKDVASTDELDVVCIGSELHPFYRPFLPIEALSWTEAVIKIKSDTLRSIPKSIEIDGIRCFIPNSIIAPRTAELFRVARVEHRMNPRLSDLPHNW